MILLPQHPGFFFFQNMYSYSFFLLWLFSKWWLYSHGIYFFPQNNNLNLNLCFFFLPPSVALILYYTVPMSRYYRCSFSAVVSFGSEWTWKYLCCWEWWVERICLPHVPALQQKKKWRRTRLLISAGALQILTSHSPSLFPLRSTSGRVSVCPKRTRHLVLFIPSLPVVDFSFQK